jgi:hypothetical protein
MKHEVATLEGALLDEAVAKAEGWKCEGNAWSLMSSTTSGQVMYGDVFPFSYSTDWKWGGPIIERERIYVMPRNEAWAASHPTHLYRDRTLEYAGATPLIAAMRAYVASKFGAEVDL